MRAKKTTKKTAAKKVAALAKSAETAATRRAKELIDLIARRMQRITEDFFEIGAALRELHEKKLYASLGFASLGDLLKAHDLMSRSRAFELIHIVRTVPRREALELGAEKAYALSRLTAATKQLDTVEELAEQGVIVGGKRRKVEDLSVRDLQRTVKAERTKSHPVKPDPEAKEAAAKARAVQAALRRRGARTATVETAKREGAWLLTVTLPVARADLLLP